MKSESFGDFLRHLRGSRSRREVAAEAGIHPQSLVKLELGTHSPSAITVARLARALDVDPGILLGALVDAAAPPQEAVRATK